MGNERENKEINEAGITFYHERQQLQYCLKHALNNLLQRPAFTIESLNDICKKQVYSFIITSFYFFGNFSLDNTSFLNPHRSILGLGNYDVNVLMVAMSSEEKDLSIIWFDSRMYGINIRYNFETQILGVMNVLKPIKSLDMYLINQVQEYGDG